MSDAKLLTDGTLIIPTDVDVKDVGRVMLEQKGTKFCSIFYRDEIIRCKDCKHHVLHPRMGVLWCTFLHSDMGYDQFCSYAERRGEE